MPFLLPTLLTVTALVAPHADAATATVWKCAGNNGDVVYQDAPCPPGTELRNFSADPPTLSVVPGTPVPAPKAAPAAAARPQRSASPPRKAAATNKAVNRKFIEIGMTQAEVIQRIGKPDVDARNQRGQGQSWSYLPNDGDPDTITTVTLVSGKVANVERKIVR
jgi:hypothetical protein